MKFIELTAASGDNVMINLDRVVKVVESAETGSIVVYTTDGLKENFICNQSKKLIEAVKGKREFKPEHGDDKPHARSMAESMAKKYSNGGIVSNKHNNKQDKRRTTVDYLTNRVKNNQKKLAKILRQQLESIESSTTGLESDIITTSRELHDYECKFFNSDDISAIELRVFTGNLRLSVEKLKKNYIRNHVWQLGDCIITPLDDVISIAGIIENFSRTIYLITH